MGQYPGMLAGSLGSYIRAQRTRITNNEIYRSARGSGSTCNGSTIVVHEPHDDLIIENNLIYEAPGTAAGGCFGIQLSSGGDAPAAFRRASISRNQVFNVGNGGIDVSECADCLIESNLVVNAADAAIAFPGELATAGDSEASARTIVRNNTVYNGAVIVNTGEAASAVEGSGHVASNNLACGKGWSVSGVRIGSGVTASNNQSPTSCAGLFVNPTSDPVTADFTPATGSVLVGAGNVASFASMAIGTVPWSLADDGMRRDASPDVGAFEEERILGAVSRTEGPHASQPPSRHHPVPGAGSRGSSRQSGPSAKANRCAPAERPTSFATARTAPRPGAWPGPTGTPARARPHPGRPGPRPWPPSRP